MIEYSPRASVRMFTRGRGREATTVMKIRLVAVVQDALHQCLPNLYLTPNVLLITERGRGTP